MSRNIQKKRLFKRWGGLKMTETITINYKVFSFEELRPEIQKKVIEKLINDKYQFNDCWQIEEDIKFGLEENEINFDKKSICFDLSCCKGYPYISFSSKMDKTDIEKFLKKNRKYAHFKELLKHYICLTIENRRDYEFNIDLDFEDSFEEYDSDLKNAVLEKQKEKLRALYSEFEEYIKNRIEAIRKDITKSALENYEYQFTEECIKDDIEANGYKFLENGKIF